MAAEITYWSGSDRQPGLSAGQVVLSETRSSSGTSAQSGVTPEDARLVSIHCTTAAVRFLYSGNPTAVAGSSYLGLEKRVWLDAKPGQKIAIINA